MRRLGQSRKLYVSSLVADDVVLSRLTMSLEYVNMADIGSTMNSSVNLD